MGDNRVKPGVNDLASSAPDLAAQWDTEKNNGLTPDKVTRYSHRKVWWRCSLGHSWNAAVNNRYQGQNCPVCSGQKVLPGFNDLATINPKLAKEWNYEKNENLRPTDFTAGALKKVWWKCAEGHEWEAAIYSRNDDFGCPYCSGRLAIKGETDLKTLMPDLIREWDFEMNQDIVPEQVTVHSSKSVWWKCSHGHKWKARVYSRANGSGCPYCAGQKVLLGFNDLATGYPKLVQEWDMEKNTPLTPADVTCSTHRKVWWRDSLGHGWQATVAERTRHGTGCPYCAGKKAWPGFNDLLSQNPDLAAEWNYDKNGSLLPQEVTIGSHISVWWKCREGHEWQSTIHNRQVNGCPICAGQQVLIGYNDLASQNPDLAVEWDYEKNGNLTPEMVTAGSDCSVWWKCKLGHGWKATIYSRKTTGCPYCAGTKVLAGFNDLGTKAPWLLESWDYERNINLAPQEVSAMSNRKVWWKCDYGHHWRSTVRSRQSGNGCPICSGILPSRRYLVP